MEHRFDRLARALSGGMSRRQALRQVGGGIAGTVLAGLGLGEAWGDPGQGKGHGCGNTCNAAFAPNSPNAAIKAANQQCKDVCEQCTTGTLCINTGVLFTECCSSGVPCSPDGFCESCFIAGTRVTMADGSEKPIEQIRVGEPVLGSEGQINRVIQVERPLLGTRRLYALNGSDYFVTAEHPFMTGEGWKAIDPAATARENPALRVDPLQPGDLLVVMRPARVPVAAGRVALAEPVVPRLASVPLARLDGRHDHPGTTVYNLRLDGGHVYFANGFLVHNKT